MTLLKIVPVGDEAGIVFTDAMLAHLKVSHGDAVQLIEHERGFTLQPLHGVPADPARGDPHEQGKK